MPKTRMLNPPSSAIAIALAALVLAACGDSNDENGTSAVSAPSDTAARPAEKPAADHGGGTRPTPVGGSGQTALQGDVPQARAGAQAVGDVYGDVGAAIADGIATDDVPVGDTLANADDAGSLTSICALMSKDAQHQTVVYAERSAGLSDVEWTCEKAMALLLRRAAARGDAGQVARATVVGVNAEGDRATATVRFGGKRGRVTTLPLVKEDGRWKLGTAPGGG